MKYLALIFLSLLWIIHSPNPANAGATHLQYDYHYNAVENLEKTPVQKNKIAEWAKQKKPVWSKKLCYKSRKPAGFILLDEDIEIILGILGSVLILAGLTFLGIGLGAVLAWALWLGGGLFVLGIVLLLWVINDTHDIEIDMILVLIAAVFLLGLVLLIIGLVSGLAWAWITGAVIFFLYIVLLLLPTFIENFKK